MKDFSKILLTTMVFCLSPILALAAPVEKVNVKLQGANSPLPKYLEKRMTAGVDTVAEHVLLGRDSADIAQDLNTYESLTAEIAGRVIYGYDIKDIRIEPGVESYVYATISPYGDVVKTVDVEFDYGNLSNLAKGLIQEDLERVKPQLDQILVGASLDAFDWIDIITENIVKDRLSEIVPDFTTKISIEPGETTLVKIYLIPQGEIIRDIQVNINSSTLPKSIFNSQKKTAEKSLSGISGLPVRYMHNKVDYIKKKLLIDLNKSRAHSTYKIDFKPQIIVGETTNINIDAKSNKYIVDASMRIDMGKEENNVSFKTHTGYFVGDGVEIYLENELYPGNYRWKIYPSIAYYLNSKTKIAYQYEIKNDESIILYKQYIGDRLGLKVQKFMPSHEFQYSIAYDLQKYMTLEYIFEKDSNWLRIIGHI